MTSVMSDITDISWCNIAQIIGESNRFLFHVMLVHITTTIIEGKKSFLGEDFFRVLIITAVAIVLYHIFFRKIMEPNIEKMKLICYNGKERYEKMKELNNRSTQKDTNEDDTKTYNYVEENGENGEDRNVSEYKNRSTQKRYNTTKYQSGTPSKRRISTYGGPREYSKR